MGGRGSGGHNSKGKTRDVQCARLDVHELSRDGKLERGMRGWLFGMLQFEVTGGPDARRLVVGFPRRSATGERLQPLEQVIVCHWQRANYRGRYLVFLCSECVRSARVLYSRFIGQQQLGFFRCGRCAGITYQSTMGHRWDRSARRVEKLRAQLEWRAGEPVKPKGMHKKSYERVLGKVAYHEAVRNQGASFARKHRPDQHRVKLWQQCRNRYSSFGGWPPR